MTDGSTAAEGFDAAEAFALLGDSTRVTILEALAGSAEDPLSFAALRERVGVEDSGRFNYHLGKLVDTFVEKTDEGYRLTFAGSRVVGAVYEGTYAEGDAIDPVELDADCPDCGGTLELSYADERVTIACGACNEPVGAFGFPPGAIAGREPEELPRLLTRHMETLLDRLRAGFCTNCSGPVTPEFEAGDGTDDGEDGSPDSSEGGAAGEAGEDEPGEAGDDGVAIVFECDRCHARADTSLSSMLLTEPAVVAFHYDHGIDVRDALPWALPWMRESTAEQVAESPPRYALAGSLDGETLRVVVDEELQVVTAERTAG